jgi:hypothetical protein
MKIAPFLHLVIDMTPRGAGGSDIRRDEPLAAQQKAPTAAQAA